MLCFVTVIGYYVTIRLSHVHNIIPYTVGAMASDSICKLLQCEQYQEFECHIMYYSRIHETFILDLHFFCTLLYLVIFYHINILINMQYRLADRLHTRTGGNNKDCCSKDPCSLFKTLILYF